MATGQRYIPAAGRSWLTGLYDPAMALTMRERAFRPALIAAVLAPPRPRRILDIGCGTGTLALRLAAADPHLQIVGLDGDEQVLARARQKTSGLGQHVSFSAGLAAQLPAPDASFDVAIASLLLHHLAPADKLRALREARRVLAPGGRLVIADWGRPHDLLMGAAFLQLRLLDGFANTRQHAAGLLPELVEQAGLHDVVVTQRWRTVWGSLELIVARAPG